MFGLEAGNAISSHKRVNEQKHVDGLLVRRVTVSDSAQVPHNCTTKISFKKAYSN